MTNRGREERTTVVALLRPLFVIRHSSLVITRRWMVRENKVKAALQAGGTSLGTMIFEFNTTGIGRIAAAAGAEFLIFDMEHTGWGIDTIRTLIATTRSADIVPLVRVPAIQYHL